MGLADLKGVYGCLTEGNFLIISFKVESYLGNPVFLKLAVRGFGSVFTFFTYFFAVICMVFTSG
jgi:hypothetical protein